MFKHTLVIGGTGMLLGISEFLAANSQNLTVNARNKDGFAYLKMKAADYSGSIKELLLDYRDSKFEKELESRFEQFGKPDLVVTWIHSPMIPVHEKILKLCGPGTKYILVLGSASADPSRSNNELETFLEKWPGINFKKVILGFKVENGVSKWLTDSEISNGVIESVIENGNEDKIIGVVEPWEKRP